MKKLFIIIWLMLIPMIAGAADYYVCPCASYPCAGTDPWDTPAKAGDFRTVFEGARADSLPTVIILLEGTHTIGSYGQLEYLWDCYDPIRLKAEDGKTAEEVIIDGESVAGQNFLKVSHYAYLYLTEIDSLTIQNCEQALYLSSFADLTLTNCIIQDNSYITESSVVYISSTGSGTITIESNIFRRNVGYQGGAIYMHKPDVIVNVLNNRFESNSSVKGGGAFWNVGKQTNTFNGNTWINNTSGTGESSGTDGRGGALYFTFENNSNAEVLITGDTFTGNQSWEAGGAISGWVYAGKTIEVVDCVFNANIITDGSDHNNNQGGAIYFVGVDTTGNVRDCEFSDNLAGSGGAIKYSYGAEGDVLRCKFTRNIATWHGGGAIEFGGHAGVPENSQNSTLKYCILDSNEATGEFGTGYGGAWGALQDHSVTACNNTYYNNKAVRGDGAHFYSVSGEHHTTVTFINEIFRNGGEDEIWGATASDVTVDHCNIQGGEAACTNVDIYTNNIDADPEFVDPEYGDFHLQISSPSIDAGDNDIWEGIACVMDIEGNEITDGSGSIIAEGGTVDIGAYEFTNLFCEGDFDDDGDVDGSDLSVFAADFGRTDCNSGDPCEGDFDGDGDVDGSDLTVFAADFGRTDCHR